MSDKLNNLEALEADEDEVQDHRRRKMPLWAIILGITVVVCALAVVVAAVISAFVLR